METTRDTDAERPDTLGHTPTFDVSTAAAGTGIEGLDFIMQGGLPAASPTLLRGGPGTGKTVISLSFLCYGLKIGEPGVLVTFDEAPQALIQHADAMGMRLGEHIEAGRARIVDMRPNYEETMIGESLELDAILTRIGHAITQTGARRLVIDAIDGLEGAFAEAGDRLKVELRRVFSWIRERDTSTVITIGEQGDFNRRYGIEDYLADCAIALKQEMVERTMMRLLRVVKRRGGGHGTNEFPYLIDQEGIFVLPLTGARLRSNPTTQRISTGIAGLDDMLGGPGIYRGATVMYSGESGTGKTTFAACSTRAACERGDDVLYVSFEEGVEELMRNQRSVGIELGGYTANPSGMGRLVLEPILAAETGWEEHLLRILRAVRQHQPAMVVVDPISALSHKAAGSNSKAMVLRLLSLLKEEAVTTITVELLPDYGGGESALNISSVIDMWVKLRREERGDKLHRLLKVMKSRGMPTADYVTEYTLSNQGVMIRGCPTATGENQQ